jgi:hypothetical protein
VPPPLLKQSDKTHSTGRPHSKGAIDNANRGRAGALARAVDLGAVITLDPDPLLLAQGWEVCSRGSTPPSCLRTDKDNLTQERERESQ